MGVKADWVHYLQSVLGVDSVLAMTPLADSSSGESAFDPTQIQQSKLLVFFHYEQQSQLDLLEKILAATQLDFTQILLVESEADVLKTLQVRPEIPVFAFAKTEDLSSYKNVLQFPTLAEIEENAQLKRPVWEKIKIALQNII